MRLSLLVCLGLIVGLCMRIGSTILVGYALVMQVGLLAKSCLDLLECKVPLGLVLIII